MGLDYYIVWVEKDKGSGKDQIEKWDSDEWDKHELCYARKGWELVYALKCDLREAVCPVALEDWIDLMERLYPISESYDRIREAYAAIERTPENEFYRLEEIRPKELKLIRLYEDWYNENFDTPPQLGYEWTLGYFKNFWEAADNVLSYLENPAYEVWQIASY